MTAIERIEVVRVLNGYRVDLVTPDSKRRLVPSLLCHGAALDFANRKSVETGLPVVEVS